MREEGVHMVDVVAVSRSIFCDLIFTGLPGAPQPGQELYAQGFALCPGGMAANSGMALARLGLKTGIVARLGRYPLGDVLLSQLEVENLDLSHLEVTEDEPTAVSVAMSTPLDRCFITYPSPSFPYGRDPTIIDLDFLANVRHVLVSASDVTPDQLARMRQMGLGITLDVGWESTRHPDSVLELLPLVDLFVPNEIESCLITGASTPVDALVELSRHVAHPVIKLGRMGSMTVADGRPLEVPSIPVDPLDTTGAGDVFAAGLIYGYLRGWKMEDCLRLGNVCGALSATGVGGGCSAPGWDQIRKAAPDLDSSIGGLGDQR